MRINSLTVSILSSNVSDFLLFLYGTANDLSRILYRQLLSLAYSHCTGLLIPALSVHAHHEEPQAQR